MKLQRIGGINIAPKKTFNEYILHDDYAALLVTRRNGDKYEIQVDIPDLYTLKEIGYRWCVKYNKNNKSWYAHTNMYSTWKNGSVKHKNVRIHTVLLGCEEEEPVDHINHNTLDNRRSNIRTVADENNSRNRKGKNINNKSGYRNVSWRYNKWIVQLQIDGKNTVLGSFDDVDEAGRFAEEMRKIHYKEFAGKG